MKAANQPLRKKSKNSKRSVKALQKELKLKEVAAHFDEEHNLWELRIVNADGAEHRVNWEFASTPEYRQMMSKYKQIEPYMEPPFIVETLPKASKAKADEELDTEAGDTGGLSPGVQNDDQKIAKKKSSEPVTVEKATARELHEYVLAEGKKEYDIQRYKGLGEMTAPQLWETTMDPERRTLLSVKLEDIAECETIFTTLMGEDVEARRKFIEENALDVKNLDI